MARRPSPAVQAQPRRRALRAVAAASALVLLPLAAIPAAAVSSTAKPKPGGRSSEALPKNLKTAGSFGAGRSAKKRGPIDVMVQLDVAPASTAYAAGLRVSPSAAGRASETQTDRVKASQDQVVSALGRPSTRGTVLFRTHALYSGVAIRTDAARLPAIAALPGVRALRVLTPKKASNSTTVPLTGAPASWQSTGQTGEGVTVGIIDTGIDYTHADFGGPGTPEAFADAQATSTKKPDFPDTAKVAGGYDFVGDAYNADTDPIPVPDTNPLDCGGHGSHVAGTAAGYGVNADGSTFDGPYDTDIDFASLQIGPGMAPGATLYALKVFGCEGSTNAVSDALDWAADPNGDGDLSDHLDVVNMSLGGDYGSPDDPDSVSTNNAVIAGISVVASIGNGGDLFEVGGSPGDASRSIAVAATDDAVDVYDGLSWAVGGDEQDVLVAQRSTAYDWANEPGLTDGNLVTLGDWSQPPSDTNNTDGCSDLSPSDAATVDGNVPLLFWTDDDSARRCGSASRSGRVKDAGAVGAVLGDQLSHRFAAGILGDTDIPVMEVNDDGTAALLDAVGSSPGDVAVTLTNALLNSTTIVSSGADDPTDQIADFSSRGTSAGSSAKPDVSAPGVTVFSAAVGTGEEGVSFSGTSMAAPHTAGLAALVIGKHRGWTPEQVKAAIMGSADHSVYAEPGKQGQPLGLMRAGTGRIDAEAAVAARTLAYNGSDAGAVSVSFGALDVTKKTTLTKKVTVVNTRATSTAAYAVGLEAVDTLPGASWSVSPSAVSLPAGASTTVTVTLTLDPLALTHKPEPSLDLDPLGLGTPAFYRDWLSVTTGRVVLDPASGTSGGPVRVGLFAAPRATSTMAASSSSVTVKGSGADKKGTITLKGTGVAVDDSTLSTVSSFELAATSGKLPSCTTTLITGCVPFADVRSADLKYVGVGSSAPLFDDPLDGLLYFAVATHGAWRTAQGLTEFDILLDLDGDGTPEAVVYSTRVPDTDVFVAETVDLATFDTVDIELINDFGGGLDTAKMHGDVMVLPVGLGYLADYYGSTFNDLGTVRYQVEAYSAYADDAVDTVGASGSGFGLAINSLAPAYTVSGAFGVTLNDDQPGEKLSVSTDASSMGVDKPQGVLLLHHLNATGNRAEVVTVKQATTTKLSLNKTTVVKGNKVKATATVALPGRSTKPTGTVQFKEGSKVLATGTLSGGKVTVTLPTLKVGKHTIVAVYQGSSTLTGSTSSSVKLTVKKKS
ncbi:MAG TPA: S8 family serine peptidase [Candidatus Limnocylindria bacterium]|nr:S8 family serine peptidase [Candidatus Limnocylindria bacterium]